MATTTTRETELRWIRRVFWALLALLVVAGVALGLYARKSLPATDGQLKLSVLKAPVEVRRDDADVTHVLAQSPLDAMRAIGYVHAQERGWQLDFNRRIMRGELSALLGPATLETDKLMRTLGLRQAAQAQWERLPPEAKAGIEAYVQGLNAFYTEGGQALSPEFLILGVDPRADARAGRYWDVYDSMGWSLMMALDLGGNWGNELARLSLLEVLDTNALWQVMPPYPGEPPAASADLASLYRGMGLYRPATEKKAEGPTASPAAERPQLADALRTRLAQDVAQWARELGNVDGKGSNNWVVAGSRSATGKPWLANDPHLGLSAPAIWYFAHLQAPAGDGMPALQVVGATLPGLPSVVLGRTDRVAWGFTNTGPDVQDLYIEQINPANPAQYRVPAAQGQMAWADFQTRAEVIRVKGQPDVQHLVRSTRHGPVLSDAQAAAAERIDTTRFALALRWAALDADNSNVLAGMLSNQSHSVAELQQAYRHFHSPMQNVLMADVSGRIAYKAAGKVPVRDPGNPIRGIAPSPGWDERYDWKGWLAYEDTPQDDGAKGWIATANQRVHGPDYPHFITQDWSAPWRQQRIEQLLEQTPRHDARSLQAIHADQLSLATQVLLPVLQRTRSEHPLATAALAQLQDFQGLMAAEGAASLIYTAWVDELTRGVIGEKVGRERFEKVYGKRLFRSGIENIMTSGDRQWCGDGGCGGASARALDRALDKLQAAYGKDPARWRWGQAHPALSVHRPFSNVPVLARLFEVRVPTGGDPFTVNVGQYHLDKQDAPYANRHAASLRALYDLSDLENSRFIYQTGQSGNVFSGRYRDMSDEWAAVQYRPLKMKPATWRSTLTLAP
jgi:penicillin amidase